MEGSLSQTKQGTQVWRACRGTLANTSRLLRPTPAPFGFHPGRGDDPTGKNILNAPHPLGERSRHRGSTGHSQVVGGTQFVMNHAKVIHTADEIHSGLKCLYPLSSMAAAAGQGSQTLSKRSVESLDKCRVQNASTLRLRQELLRLLERPLRHAPDDLDDA